MNSGVDIGKRLQTIGGDSANISRCGEVLILWDNLKAKWRNGEKR
jgi:hypothetical protein